MVLTIFLPCIIACDNDICDLFARWCKQGVLCAQNPSWGRVRLRFRPDCRTAWTDMQHDSFYTHDCTLQSLGTPSFQELAAVVLTTSIFCHLCIIQSITAMLLVVLPLQWKCILPSFAGQVLLQSLCSLCCCVFKTLDICRQVHGKQHTSLHLLAECYGVQFVKSVSHGILQV